jgi:hypothetical protein
VNPRRKKKSKEQRELEAAAAWLCVEYLQTILPKRTYNQIHELVLNHFVRGARNPRTREERMWRMFTARIALMLEKIRGKDGIMRINARIIGKFDDAPLKGICQDGSTLARIMKDDSTETP